MSFAQNTPIQFIPGIGWRTAEVMHDLGIHTVGHLGHIPENILIELFGPSIRSILNLVGQAAPARRVGPTPDDAAFRASNNTPAKSKPSFTQRLRIATRMMAML
jgi:nucleotidyltransferase/DNA polymerase involved in DNA repair